MSDSGYGPEKYHFDGASLPSLIRKTCATPVVVWDGRPAPTLWQVVTAWMAGRR